MNCFLPNPPPRRNNELPIIIELKEGYLLWHSFYVRIPRMMRYTLGVRADELFISLLEITLTAQYAKRDQKLLILEQISRRMDVLKFFITLLWEVKAFDVNKYGQLSQKIAATGRMLGKWMQSLSQTPR